MKKSAAIIFVIALCVALFSFAAGATSENTDVAAIGDVKYETLELAVAAVPTDGTKTTVTLLGDTSGSGIVVNEGQSIVLELNGFTYTVVAPTVGSEGTKTLGFQLLKGSEVEIRNGRITSAIAKMLVQNYSELVLEDVILDGTESEKCQYTLSNNFGSALITGDSEILGDENTVAFDLWYGMYESYDEGVSVCFDEDFTGKVEGKIEYGAASRVTGNDWTEKTPLVIKGGTFEGELVSTCSLDIADGNITVVGGTFTADPSAFIDEAEYMAEYDVYKDTYSVCKKTPAAAIGEVKYDTLEAAVAAVPADGTRTAIALLRNANGSGIVVNEGQSIVLELNGFTYTVVAPTVGSEGTKTLGFQLLKGSEVEIRNGRITSAIAKMLVQNYSELVLEDVILDGTESPDCQYTLSNNFGSALITGDSEILGDENTVAFDLWYGMYESYDEGVSVCFDEDFTGKVEGKIEYGAASRVTGNDWTEKTPLVIKGGTFEGELVSTCSLDIADGNITVYDGRFSNPVAEEYCTEGYEPAVFADGLYGVCNHPNKKVFDTLERTCTVDGYDKFKCVKCEFVETIIYYAGGHSFTKYVSNSDETYTEDGTKTAYCNYGCGATDTLENTGSKKVLGTPGNLTSVHKADSVTLTWDVVEGATGYRVFIRNTATSKWDIAVRSTGKKTTVTFKGLEPGTKYTYAVRAYVNVGTIIWAPKYASVYAATLPPVVTELKAAQSESTVTLSWSKVSCSGYRVFRWNTEKRSWDIVVRATAANKVTLKGLEAGTSYIFCVRPYVNTGTQIVWASNYTKLTTSTMMQAPSIKGWSSAAGRATVGWGKVDTATGYQLWYSTSKTTGYKKVSNYSGTSTYHHGLTSGTTYYYRVRAYKAVGGSYVYSSWSDILTVVAK